MLRSNLLAFSLSAGSTMPWRSFSAIAGLSRAEAWSPYTTLGLTEVPSPGAAKVETSWVAARPEVTLDFVEALAVGPFFLSSGRSRGSFFLASTACFPFFTGKMSSASSRSHIFLLNIIPTAGLHVPRIKGKAPKKSLRMKDILDRVKLPLL